MIYANKNRIIVQDSGSEYPPFVVVIQDGVPLVAERVNYKRLESLTSIGYEVDDPCGFLVCHCGLFKAWWNMECDACDGDHADAVDDRQSQYDMSIGG